MERAALEPRPTSSMPVTVPSASLPISWVRAREQESVLLLFTLALHKMLCSGIFSLPFLFVFKIWTTDLPNCQGCSLAPAPLCVHQKGGFPLEHFFPVGGRERSLSSLDSNSNPAKTCCILCSAQNTKLCWWKIFSFQQTASSHLRKETKIP